MAAGALLIQESGGVVLDPSGKGKNSHWVWKSVVISQPFPSIFKVQWNLALVNFQIVKNLAIVKTSGDTD